MEDIIDDISSRINSIGDEEFVNLLDNIIEIDNASLFGYTISRMANFDTSVEIQVLIFKVIPHLATYDANVIGNVLTVIQRLEQKEFDWRNPDNIEILSNFIRRCRGVEAILQDNIMELEGLGDS